MVRVERLGLEPLQTIEMHDRTQNYVADFNIRANASGRSRGEHHEVGIHFGDDLLPNIFVRKVPFAGGSWCPAEQVGIGLKTTTFFPPIFVIQYAPRRFASSAGLPLRILLEMEAKLCV